MQGPLEASVKGLLLFCLLGMIFLIWNWNQKLLFYPLWKVMLLLSGFLLLSVLLPFGFFLGQEALLREWILWLFLVLLLFPYTLLIGLSFRPPRNPLAHGGDSLFWFIQFFFLAIVQSWSSIQLMEVTLFALALLGTRVVFFFLFSQAGNVKIPLWELFFPMVFFCFLAYSFLLLEIPLFMSFALFIPFLGKHLVQLTSWREQKKRFILQYGLIFFPTLFAVFWYSFF